MIAILSRRERPAPGQRYISPLYPLSLIVTETISPGCFPILARISFRIPMM